MKTSNKLLIIVALALFVIPVLGMIYHAKISRVDGRMYEATIKIEGESTEVEDQFLVSRKVDHFDKVVIEGANILNANISILKSDRELVKFDKNTAPDFTTSIDKETNTLIIKVDSMKRYRYASLFIFTKSLETVHFNSLQVSSFATNLDSINIIATKIDNTFNFRENANLKSLNLTASNSTFRIGKSNRAESFLTGLQAFHLSIKNGGVSLDPNTYNLMNVDVQDASFNLITENNDTSRVQELNINSHGNSQISIPEKSIEFAKVTGSLSDSTTTNLPYYRTKNLFK